MPRILEASSAASATDLASLYAAALAAAPGVDLRFDHNPGRARIEKLSGCGFGFLRSFRHLTAWHRRPHTSLGFLWPGIREFS